MQSNSPFSGELIQQTTEAVGSFLQWIAELIVSRNWFSLLILVAITGIFLLNPASGLAFKVFGIDPQTLPASYAKGFWLVEVGLVLAALAIAIRTMPRTLPASQADLADRKAIKGLRPSTAATRQCSPSCSASAICGTAWTQSRAALFGLGFSTGNLAVARPLFCRPGSCQG